jgi:acyl carrier protein
VVNIHRCRADTVRIEEAPVEDVKERIRQWILTEHLPGESAANLRDDTPLQTSGILDSLATMGLITSIEREYGVELDVYDTTLERFDRIRDIAATIERKLTKS